MEVALIARSDVDRQQLGRALANITRRRWTLVSVIEPDARMQALQLLLGGSVDAFVVVRREYLPRMYVTADIGKPGVVRPTAEDLRTMPVEPWRNGREVSHERVAGPVRPPEEMAFVPGQRRAQLLHDRPASRPAPSLEDAK
ncbi:hypothetical protein ACQP2F_14340 [Actinoplanes sp. CA-030573]|uniref:hypothetical protein n=1 Tax=Actinoplanes sp. CA-030573 TaxID=3239898 RepID=UPI003D915C46